MNGRGTPGRLDPRHPLARAGLLLAAVAVAGWAAVSPAAAGLIIAGSPTFDTGTGLVGGGVPIAPGGAVNNSGTAVGWSDKYDTGGYRGLRAVRWDTSGTAATELGNLGLSSGYTEAQAYAVNDAGTAVGYSRKYDSGSSVGFR